MILAPSIKPDSQYSCEDVDCINNTPDNVAKYQKSHFKNTYYLGYRDIPYLLKKYKVGRKAIDYGCGAGRSTHFLKSIGFEVVGVDISSEMLAQAPRMNDPSHYLLIKSAYLPFLDDSYDLIFSCFVFFTVPSIQELQAIFKESFRCLKKGGFLIFVTGSEHLYSHQWLSYDVDYPENLHLKSGDRAKIYLKDLDIEFINYFWSDTDYENCAAYANFRILEKHHPFGKPTEEYSWISEDRYSPYVIYVMQKE